MIQCASVFDVFIKSKAHTICRLCLNPAQVAAADYVELRPLRIMADEQMIAEPEMEPEPRPEVASAPMWADEPNTPWIVNGYNTSRNNVDVMPHWMRRALPSQALAPMSAAASALVQAGPPLPEQPTLQSDERVEEWPQRIICGPDEFVYLNCIYVLLDNF